MSTSTRHNPHAAANSDKARQSAGLSCRSLAKGFLATALLAGTAVPATAGGFLTNSNQSVSFLRNPARDAYISIDAAYSNPAGIGFLSKGWHMGFDIQSAFQSRTITSMFPGYELGTVNGVRNPGKEKKFDGKAKAPVIPSIDLARVGEKWFASFHFGITGGGGKCTFDDGLGLFESQVAMLPTLVGVLAPGAVDGYSITTHTQGRQYYFGGQFGVGYKVLPNLSVSVGGRVVYADCNYYGYVRDINLSVKTAAGTVQVPAATFFESQGLPHFASLVADKELNCDQSGWGFTPIIGIDYKIGNLNLAAKYEFKTRMRLKNKAGVNTSGLDEYDDGKKIAADIPAILTLGACYELLDKVRLSGGFHYYFDKQATQYENREEHLDGGGWEVLAGVEYDINKRWTVSAGWQTTHYGLGDEGKFLTNLSFVTNSNSIGFGARFQVLDKVALNVAYFKTIYKHYKKEMQDYNDIKATFKGKLTPMLAQLAAGKEQYQAAIASGQLSAEQAAAAQQQIDIIDNEITAAQAVAQGLASYSTAGYDTFHRTNDVFGIGLEIDF